jgi:hypothetical protein
MTKKIAKATRKRNQQALLEWYEPIHRAKSKVIKKLCKKRGIPYKEIKLSTSWSANMDSWLDSLGLPNVDLPISYPTNDAIPEFLS